MEKIVRDERALRLNKQAQEEVRSKAEQYWVENKDLLTTKYSPECWWGDIAECKNPVIAALHPHDACMYSCKKYFPDP